MSIESNKKAFETVKRKFTSANSIPVERATVTRSELTGAFRHWLFTLTDNHLNEDSDCEFNEWLIDPATHWISDQDAAYQAWNKQQETIDKLY